METISISQRTARRFVLGKQGLWPGRRWSGKPGVEHALKEIEAVQLDPLNVLARSHDLVLWSRVVGYRPEHLDQLLYTDRALFDYGGWLAVYPMAELPYWRLPMRRRRDDRRWGAFAAANRALIDATLAAVRERGPLGNRDLAGTAKINSYRGGKDSALALYYLWLTGELMVARRNRFERVYDLRERVAPPALDFEAPEAEAEAFFARKTVSFMGLISDNGLRTGWSGFIERPVSTQEGRAQLDAMLDAGIVLRVHVQGWRKPQVVLADDLPLLEALEDGKLPPAWRPLGPTTEHEAVLLAPLDIVSARGRAKSLFDFEYVWEVYKPAAKRRWGYYTLPVLYGDRLVARLDPKLDRAKRTLQILGFWLEPTAPAADPQFKAALRNCLAHIAAFAGAERVDDPWWAMVFTT